MKENNTAIFTVIKTGKNYDIKCKKYNLYNQIDVSKDYLYEKMEQLTDFFNNVLHKGILFEIG